LLAFLTRYGHQPLDQVRRLTHREAAAYAKALGRIIDDENKAPGK
jgi:hypothetical protein